MSKNSTIIIVRNPGSDLPEAYLRLVLKAANSCGGYAVQTKDDTGTPMIISDRVDAGLELEAVQELLKGYANERIMLAFSKLDKVDPKSMQPYDFLMEGDSAPLMSYAIEGDFPSMVEGSTPTHEVFATQVIDPSFRKFLKYSGGDLEKFLEELKDITFTDNIMSRIGDRGQFVFLPPVGDAILVGKNKLSSHFPWGFVSNTLDYKEKAPKNAEQVTETETKKTGWFSPNWGGKKLLSLPDQERKEPKVDIPPAPDHKDVPLEDKPHVKDAPLVEQTPQDTTKPPEGEWKEVPGGLSKKDRKAFIRRVTNCGNNFPDGWDKPGYKYWAVKYPSAAKEIHELAEKFNNNAPKDMRSSNTPKVLPKRGSEVITEANSLVLTPEEKSAAETSLLKIMDRKGNEIPSPEDLQKMEVKYPTFSKQFGVTQEQINSWSPKDIEFFAKDNGKAFFHMYLETRRALIDAQKVAPATIEEPVKVEIEEKPVIEKKVANGGWSSWARSNTPVG